MSKFSVVVRIMLLIALVVLLVAVIWGVTHRTTVNPSGSLSNGVETVRPRGSSAAAAIFLTIMVVLGTIVVTISLVFKL